MKALSSPLGRARHSQQGVVLFVAMIVLIVMTLAGLALMRQMGAGVSIAGNVAFKENATSVADLGVEKARQWIQANAAVTSIDSPVPDGYYSSWTAGTDPTTLPWDTGSRLLINDLNGTGNTTHLIIQRLCALTGLAPDAPTQHCSDSPAQDGGGSKNGGGYPSVLSGLTPHPFYRITTRVDGPRKTVSYTQVITQ